MYGFEMVAEKEPGSMSGRYVRPFTTLAGLSGMTAVDGSGLAAGEGDGTIDGATDAGADGATTHGAGCDAIGAADGAVDGDGCGVVAHAVTIRLRLVTMLAVTAPQAIRPVMVIAEATPADRHRRPVLWSRPCNVVAIRWS